MGLKVSHVGWCLLLSMVIIIGCNEPEFVGSDLIEDDAIKVETIDTFTILMRTLMGEDITVYERVRTEPAEMMAGNMEDNAFGRNEASFYLQYRTIFPVPQISDLNDLVVDSVILRLEYDTSRFYGDFNNKHTFEVFRVNEPISNTGPYLQDVSFSVEQDPIGVLEDFVARPDQFFRLVIPSNDPMPDTINVAPHLNIPLDNDLGVELLSLDSVDFANDSILQEEIFNGLYIRERADYISGSFLGFTPRIQNPFIQSGRISGLQIYYREIKPDTTIYGSYRLTTTGSAAIQNMDFDYSGSMLEMSTADPGYDSLNFMQGFNGPEIEVEFPYIRNLGDILINQADLEIYLASPEGYNYDEYDPVFFVRTTEVLESGELENTREYNLAFNQNAPNFFGGSAEEIIVDDEVVGLRYTFSLAEHFQKMVEGKVTNTMRLLVSPKNTNPQRSIMYGTSGASMPARLKITYSVN